MLYERRRRSRPDAFDYLSASVVPARTRRPPATRENLAKVRVLYRSPDTLALWGICYEMRAGQQPKDIARDFRGDWIWLGQPGWFGTMSREEIDSTKAFLAEHDGEIPNGPHEWTTLGKEQGR